MAAVEREIYQSALTAHHVTKTVSAAFSHLSSLLFYRRFLSAGVTLGVLASLPFHLAVVELREENSPSLLTF